MVIYVSIEGQELILFVYSPSVPAGSDEVVIHSLMLLVVVYMCMSYGIEVDSILAFGIHNQT